jgi:hypothetical protein
VVLPMAAAGGVAALVLTFGHSDPSPSAQPRTTAYQTLVSVRTAAPPAPLPPVVVRPTSSHPPEVARSPQPTPSPDRRDLLQPHVPLPTSARAVSPRARVDLPPTRTHPTTTTVAAQPTATTAPPVTSTTEPTTEPTTGPPLTTEPPTLQPPTTEPPPVSPAPSPTP